jgi:catechol 2,3-dioxygenase-like lactoylglutathione lyase family enzyme
VEQRISIVTLGVADLQRSLAFYEQLGWHGQVVQETAFFQAGALVLVLWDRATLAADAGVEAGPDGAGSVSFGGMTLAHNVRSREEVDQIVEQARQAGAVITTPPAETFYGGYAAYFRDPDGHLWEIAHNPGFTLGPDGALVLPDFSAGQGHETD